MVCRVAEEVTTHDSGLERAQQEYTQSFLRLVDGGKAELTTAPTALQRHHLRSARAKRKLENVFFAITAVMALIVAIFGGVKLFSPASTQPEQMAMVTVTPGESLWSLAKTYSPAGSSTADTVAAIRDANPGLGDQPLAVGQRLLVPSDSPAYQSTLMASAAMNQNRHF